MSDGVFPRGPYLNLLKSMCIKAADEALCRDSEQRLRQAAAEIYEAMRAEEKRLLGKPEDEP